MLPDDDDEEEDDEEVEEAVEEEAEDEDVQEIEIIPLDEVDEVDKEMLSVDVAIDKETDEESNEGNCPNDEEFTTSSERSVTPEVESPSPPQPPPIKRRKTKSTNSEGFQGVVETDALCRGCNTVQYGNWIECERCRLWLCEECVPRQSRFQLRNVSFNCHTCTRRQAQLRRRPRSKDNV